MLKLNNRKIKYLMLILSVTFLVFSVNYFIKHISDIELSPYSNLITKKIIAEEKFLLDVKKSSNIYLLHNTQIGSGVVEFKLIRNDGKMIEKYKFSKDNFINKVIKLDEGTYYCTIKREGIEYKESFRFYFDKRFIKQSYIKNESETAS